MGGGDINFNQMLMNKPDFPLGNIFKLHESCLEVWHIFTTSFTLLFNLTHISVTVYISKYGLAHFVLFCEEISYL